MISGIFYKGSGLGNQLHRYIATRCAALNAKTDFGMVNPELFKGAHFMNLDMGKLPVFEHIFNEEKIMNRNGDDVRVYDKNFEDIKDNTLIDGEFQDEKYWEKHKKEVDEWLRVDKLDMPDDLCVINFRGGEYVGLPHLFLPKSYWVDAIARILAVYPQMRFEVHTDDLQTAWQFFPSFPIVSDMAKNWRAIRYAKHLILSNSSFAILPAWLNEDAKEIYAPKYWARRNLGYWALPQNEYKKFTYI